MSEEEKNGGDFKSRLKGRGRFLAHVIHHGLEATCRTPDDFLQHFPPTAIMEGLSKRPALRAKILSVTTGLKDKVGAKIEAGVAADLLSTALEARETTSAEIVSAFHPDDMVRNLDVRDLWAYVTEGKFWKEADGMAFEIAKSHVAFILDQAMADRMLKPRDVVDGITFDILAERLPRPELGWMLANAVERGRQSKSFSDEDLLKEAPIGVLAEHIPLPLLWDAVVVARVAEPNELTKPAALAASEPPPLAPEPTRAGGVVMSSLQKEADPPLDFSDVTDTSDAEIVAAVDGER